ncbi:hypothetical protein [Tengunoibacter tsumagoiensis]|uniref:Uncharacterized protein n=1 Tax=Tengunoibacter tsumagoiensis TaxID=2014871 RepID=A0A402A7D0_9CHLR|nr:hypothetical protein [Tengunoibacter tsumagoiensis]GCE15067.1 hypothetical protein KTT_49260 [Tengunoibacter tsumagoiensis]
MKKKPNDCTALMSHPYLATGSVQVRAALNALEHLLMSSTQEKVLLLLEQASLEELAQLCIERLLLYTPVKSILVLVPPKMKGSLIASWKHLVIWNNECTYAEQCSLQFQSISDQAAHVCLTTLIDIQKQGGIDSVQTFFRAFDVLVLYDVPSNPGPVWSQVVDFFAVSGTRVIGLSSQLTSEDGSLFFGAVADGKSPMDQKSRQACP